MPGPHHRGHRLFRQPFIAQPGFVLPLEQTADHDVDLALRELLDEHVARLHVQLDAQLRILARDDHDGLRDQTERGPRDGAEAHVPGKPGLERVDFLARLAQRRQRDARVTDHRFAIPVRPHAARLPLEQRHAEHVLEILEQLRGRRLRHVEHLGGAMNVAFIADRGEQHELARLESRANKPGCSRRHVLVFPRPQAYYIPMNIAP